LSAMQPARRRTALAGILAAVFVSGTGIGSILPILPLYLRERGASYALVGVVVAAALVAQAVGQWPAGWLADRLGRREMMVAGLLLSAAASLVFVLPGWWCCGLCRDWGSRLRPRPSGPPWRTSCHPRSWGWRMGGCRRPGCRA
jgi:MFS family permease